MLLLLLHVLLQNVALDRGSRAKKTSCPLLCHKNMSRRCQMLRLLCKGNFSIAFFFFLLSTLAGWISAHQWADSIFQHPPYGNKANNRTAPNPLRRCPKVSDSGCPEPQLFASAPCYIMAQYWKSSFKQKWEVNLKRSGRNSWQVTSLETCPSARTVTFSGGIASGCQFAGWRHLELAKARIRGVVSPSLPPQVPAML